ncbi:MAG: ATP-binding protein [Firmicutes bacterium]|nr:ATP-binding protein [Bacillota bacterium]
MNIIAQALRDGKRVLFVSEKRAALEVVYQRLKEVGLASLCLDLHSTKASRKAVVEDLHENLARLSSWNESWDRAAFERYRDIRKRLKDYVDELHRPRDRRGRTAYQIYGAWARIDDVARVDAPLPFSRILEVEPAHEDSIVEVLEAIGRLGVWDGESSHPWRDVICSDDYVAIPDVVASACEGVSKAYDVLCSVARGIEEFIGYRPETAAEVQNETAVLNRLGVRPLTVVREDWVNASPDERAALLELARSVRDQVRRRSRALSELEQLGVTPAAIDGSTWRLLCGEVERAEQRPRFQRLFIRWKVARRLGRCINRKVRLRDAVNAIRAWRAVQDVEEWVQRHAELLRERLGLSPSADNLEEQAEGIMEALAWALDLIQARGGIVPEILRRAMTQDDPKEVRARAQELEGRAIDALEALKAATSGREIVALFGDGADGHRWNDWPLPEARATTARWSKEAGRLPEWLEHRRRLAQASRLGLDGFLSACRAAEIPANRLLDAFWRTYYARWLAEAYQASLVLRNFDGKEHERLRRQFQDLEKKLQREAVTATFEMVAARLPRPLPASEYTVLAREVKKRRRHLPLRRLFPQIPTLLMAVKPCLMMSPLSVATYLPRTMFSFDLVIIDEASQLRPGDAIGALLRARQAVIFGDRWQLPPTDYFQRVVDGDDETDATDFESILDIAETYFPGPMLRWHYRSRDERLIAFSNQYFYRNQLITFPCPRRDNSETGVQYVHVSNGVYGRGASRTNPTEARRVAELALDHCLRHPELSLGIVTMNSEQRDAVEEAFRRLLREHPDVSLPTQEGLFIKNLETVQGDERDVVILSVGYGPSEPGGMPSLQFGPLARMGGERRLNVGISRARHRMIVVASMLPQQLASVVEKSRWEGPKLLAKYLAYAERGGVLTEVRGTGEPDNEFEEAVRDALIQRGYQVDCQVGVSSYRIDLAVRDPDYPDWYLAGIECDGATYHSAKTARDRDRIRQLALEQMGWTILRVWSTDWFRDPKRVTDRLVAAIERLRQERPVATKGAGMPGAHPWMPEQTVLNLEPGETRQPLRSEMTERLTAKPSLPPYEAFHKPPAGGTVGFPFSRRTGCASGAFEADR